ncbi:proline-rich protein HaeIII subfamily 1-like [Sarcophilus harrisii]|uniref:proline-rich protein HaeIII subfamily 1-like n=1 Tax=Sarcophilus harrisii TaxID=9305 RepID=UPI001301AF10|nr:proline-rich protein HaeIII subfamily 1-like [Sarcophilus harrisii]
MADLHRHTRLPKVWALRVAVLVTTPQKCKPGEGPSLRRQTLEGRVTSSRPRPSARDVIARPLPAETPSPRQGTRGGSALARRGRHGPEGQRPKPPAGPHPPRRAHSLSLPAGPGSLRLRVPLALQQPKPESWRAGGRALGAGSGPRAPEPPPLRSPLGSGSAPAANASPPKTTPPLPRATPLRGLQSRGSGRGRARPRPRQPRVLPPPRRAATGGPSAPPPAHPGPEGASANLRRLRASAPPARPPLLPL